VNPPSAQASLLRQTIVESGDGRRRLGAGLVGLVVLGLTLGATAHVAVHAKRLELAIALGEQERIFRELTLQRRHLEIEVGMLKDPARVIAVARDQLGMHPPAPEDIRALGQLREPGKSCRRSDGPDPSGAKPATPHRPSSARRPLPAARGEVPGQGLEAGRE
jgi:cell division protein FtsL